MGKRGLPSKAQTDPSQRARRARRRTPHVRNLFPRTKNSVTGGKARLTFDRNEWNIEVDRKLKGWCTK